MPQSSKPLDHVAVAIMLVLCASWGFNQIAAKVVLADIPPITQSALRSLGATLVLGAYAAWREREIFQPDNRFGLASPPA